MKWLMLVVLFSCSKKYENMWCAGSDQKRQLCYKDQETCQLKQQETNSGVSCRPYEW